MRYLKYLLAPFSWLYGMGVGLRNRLYDKEYYSSTEFTVPMICVGNLSTGGTGKTPMVEFLIENFYYDYIMAVLSRGYRRNTHGFLIANSQSTAKQIGDEPYQYYLKYPKITVAVCEDRVYAVPHLLAERPEIEVIILDDAFQHRSIRAGINILLTRMDKPYWKDHLLPMGSLRESTAGMKRAHIIVVTRCSPQLTEDQAMQSRQEIDPSSNQSVYFSCIQYGTVYALFQPEKTINLSDYNVLAVSGIANDEDYQNYLSQNAKSFQFLKFADHYNFNLSSVEEIKDTFAALPDPKVVICTEKDATKLLSMKEEWSNFPIYVQPIKTEILFGQKDAFLREVQTYITEKIENEQ